MNISQAELAALIRVGEPLVIEAEALQNSSLEIMDMNLVLDHLKPEIVRGSVCQSGLDAPTRQPHRECLRMMIAAETAT